MGQAHAWNSVWWAGIARDRVQHLQPVIAAVLCRSQVFLWPEYVLPALVAQGISAAACPFGCWHILINDAQVAAASLRKLLPELLDERCTLSEFKFEIAYGAFRSQAH